MKTMFSYRQSEQLTGILTNGIPDCEVFLLCFLTRENRVGGGLYRAFMVSSLTQVTKSGYMAESLGTTYSIIH